MKKLAVALGCAILALTSSYAQVQCFGSGAFRQCYDATSGNSYSIQKFGNMTTMQGSNASTGSNWSETSQTFGNTTYINGTAANGNSWNSTIISNPGMQQQYGTDSNGNSFSRTCTALGCY